jgi:hypothetical protein
MIEEWPKATSHRCRRFVSNQGEFDELGGEGAMDKSKPTINTEIIPYIFYRDFPATLDWLAHAFGASPRRCALVL